MQIWHETAPLDNNVREGRRQLNVAEQTWYRWRRQFGGMEVFRAKCLRTLERANTALKWLVGELTLDNRILNGRRRLMVDAYQLWLY